jgi:hypothetical protein
LRLVIFDVAIVAAPSSTAPTGVGTGRTASGSVRAADCDSDPGDCTACAPRMSGGQEPLEQRTVTLQTQ